MCFRSTHVFGSVSPPQPCGHLSLWVLVGKAGREAHRGETAPGAQPRGEHGREAPPLQQCWGWLRYESLMQPSWPAPQVHQDPNTSGMHQMARAATEHNNDGSGSSRERACRASPALNLGKDRALGPGRWSLGRRLTKLSLEATLSPDPHLTRRSKLAPWGPGF